MEKLICRNCGAEVDPKNEKCPCCRKDPRKRNQSSKAGFVIIVLAVVIAASAVMIGLNFQALKKEFLRILPEKVVSALVTKEQSEPTSTASSTESAASAEPSTSEAKTEPQKTTEPSKEPSNNENGFNLLSAEITEIPVLSSEGTEVSKRGLLKAKKSQLKAVSQAEFSAFCLQKISRSQYCFLTIEFEDSTGIVFTGNCATSAVYCSLDENGCIGSVFGTILLSNDGNFVFTENKEVKKNTAQAEKDETTKPSKKNETAPTKKNSSDSKNKKAKNK